MAEICTSNVQVMVPIDVARRSLHLPVGGTELQVEGGSTTLTPWPGAVRMPWSWSSGHMSARAWIELRPSAAARCELVVCLFRTGLARLLAERRVQDVADGAALAVRRAIEARAGVSSHRAEAG